MSKKQNKSRLVLWIILGALLCSLLLGGAYGWFFWYVPYRDAQNTMPADGIMTLQEQSDGSLLLTWPVGYFLVSEFLILPFLRLFR